MLNLHLIHNICEVLLISLFKFNNIFIYVGNNSYVTKYFVNQNEAKFLMYNDLDEFIENWESKITQLTDYISELENQVRKYQQLLKEKEDRITRLLQENSELKSQVQLSKKQTISPVYSSGYTPSILASQKPVASSLSSNDVSSLNKRQCPNCGVMGFAIKEVEDRTRILSYIPRRIYAIKKVCTKCRFEW